MDILSARKILSVTQQVLSTSYNRVTWKFSSNGKSTDLSQSYIVFRMTFMNAKTNTAITKNEYYALLLKNLCISFGDANGKSYTPACLIKHARLSMGGALVEEVLFSNIWTQTLAQLTNDIESLQSNSLLTCSVSNFTVNGSLANQIASSIRNYAVSGSEGVPIEIHIKLGDIFGVCKNTNFIMDKVGGEMMIDLELEDVKSLLQLRAIGQTYPAPVEQTISGLTDRLETSRFSTIAFEQGDVGQTSYKYVDNKVINSPFIDGVITVPLQNPDGLLYNSNLFKNFWNPADPDSQLSVGTVNSLSFLNTAITTEQLNVLGFQDGNYMRLNFQRVDGSGLTAPVMFHYMVQITEIATGVVSFNIPFHPPLPIVPNGLLTDVQLKNVNVFRGFNITGQYNISDIEVVKIGSILDITPGTTSNIATFLKTGVIEAEAPVDLLFGMGIISTAVPTANPETAGTLFVVNKDSSQIMVQLTPLNSTNVDEVLYATPTADVFQNPDSATQRKIFSNQLTTLPIQGTNAVIESVDYNSTTQKYTMKLKNLGTEGELNNALQVGVTVKNLNGREATVVPLGGTFPGYTEVGPQDNVGIQCDIYIYKHRSRNTTLSIDDCIAGQTYRINSTGSTLAQWNTLRVLPEPALTSNTIGTAFFCNVSANVAANLGTGTVTVISGIENVPISWNIDKSEIVLLESSDVSLPMSNIFSTVKCEPFTIENANDLYNRMFVIPEQNVYNAYCMMPQDRSDDGNEQSLISYNRNVQSIVWSINNIQKFNRPMELMNNTSSHPSSLQIESMMDVFENSEHKLKSISGIQSLVRTNRETPVIAPMIKIYSAIDSMNNYLKPQGCTLQLTLNGDRAHNKLIIPGNCYLYKECLRMLPM